MPNDVTIGRRLVESIQAALPNNKAASTLFTFDVFRRFEEVDEGGAVLVFPEDFTPTRRSRGSWSKAIILGIAQVVKVSPGDDTRCESWLDNWDSITDVVQSFTNVDEVTPFEGRYDLDYLTTHSRLVCRASLTINFPIEN